MIDFYLLPHIPHFILILCGPMYSHVKFTSGQTLHRGYFQFVFISLFDSVLCNVREVFDYQLNWLSSTRTIIVLHQKFSPDFFFFFFFFFFFSIKL